LSRNAESKPVSQKHAAGRAFPAPSLVNSNAWANGPSIPCLSSSETGSSVTKIPMNRIATSVIGCQENSLSRRMAGGVMRHEIKPASTAAGTGNTLFVMLTARIRISAMLAQP
jgi:hypothetical protein